jgi:cyclopropane fatty-acyl-phospholipid synthase-like methyltransferase
VSSAAARGLGRRIDFTQTLHASTARDYVARVVEHDKAESAAVAQRYDVEYWDGERRYGYGGYRYDGRWLPVAEAMVQHYGLAAGNRVLDVGCGKGFLLYELTRAVPGVEVAGIDVSAYALAHAKEEVAPQLIAGSADALPYADAAFDLVISLGTLHNLGVAALFSALREIERVSRGAAYVMVESYRNEREKANLLYWQLTCRSFYSVEDWEWIFREAGYRGDYGFIFFT